ncbi:MAG: DUF4340 domain-containing protein, partial [Firmicutes bacterium]|nr:DUF4340 domain-containing protein [Bacillota bacterium]
MANKRIQRERKLIIVLAALSVFFFALTFGIKALENRDVDLDQVYIDEASMTDYLSRLELTDSTGHYVLINQDGAWHLEGHDEVPISDLRITETRSVAKYLAPGRILTGQGDNLAAFGLDEPQALVKMVSASGEKTYLVGDYNPVTNEYYVALEGSDTVFLLPRVDGDSLKKAIVRYVDDPPVSDLVFSDLGEIRVSQGGRSYVISFSDGKYTVTNDEGTFEAEHAQVMELFNCFTYSAGY